ncbi:MAG: GAF domain-containing protein [Coleofasciculus sp. Co-bin14]|nr:GAF domain-containing protein [Coleofasciculus sp. Co-bin14]
MVYSLTSAVSGTIEPSFMQEHKGSLMHYPVDFAQFGQQITQIILTSSDCQTLMAKIAKTLGEIFQVDTCLILTGVSPGRTNQITLWRADDDSAISPAYQVRLLEHLRLIDDVTNRELLAIPDLQASDLDNSKDWCWEILSTEILSTRAVLKIHTWFQSSVNGTIVLGRSQPYEWTAQEKDLLSYVAQSVAIAISQVQLTRQVITAAQYQTLLNQLSVAFHSSLNFEEILQRAIATTGESLQVDRALILLLKYTDPLYKTRPSKQLPKTKITVACEWLQETTEQSVQGTASVSSLLNQSFWLSESSLCQQAFNNAPQPLVITDQDDSPAVELASESLSIFDREIMPARVIVPLVGTPSNRHLAGTVLGFLVLEACQPHFWQAEELELVKWVSTQVSATLIHNQTLRQVQSLVEERTAQLQQSLDVQAKLYEKTRQQIDQLQHLNQLKEEFMSTMSHELRTPLTTMSLAIRMLRQPTLPVERREKYLEILEEQCNKEIDLINDLLSLQQLESNQSQLQLQKIDLMVLVKKLAQSFEQKWADKRLTLVVESPVRSLMLNTDPDSLNRILLELLTNAGKYSDQDTQVHLQIDRQRQRSINQVILTLTNTGRGISPTELTHIFDKFRRGQGVTQQAVQGTGLGLALVKCLVEHLEGTIDVKSYPSENSQTSLTSFTLTLPQLQQ